MADSLGFAISFIKSNNVSQNDLFSICKSLKKFGLYAHIGIIVITGNTHDPSNVRSYLLKCLINQILSITFCKHGLELTCAKFGEV